MVLETPVKPLDLKKNTDVYERSLVLIAEIFYERFFRSDKTHLKVCTVAWFWQPASGQFFSHFLRNTGDFHLWFPALIKYQHKLAATF